ncbi:MAG: hypothetical protein KA175_11940, partial [Flavobacteriales bacterium]|nr:hypothetical protein [Flavobacteriales bacterium]
MRPFAARASVLLPSWILALTTMGQCTVHSFSEMPGVCGGFLNVSCGPGIHSILWSDGQTFFQGYCNLYG